MPPKVSQPKRDKENPEENTSGKGRVLFVIHFIRGETPDSSSLRSSE
jgi:hypothetical protein